jgi:putative FmdB family regulatory protein
MPLYEYQCEKCGNVFEVMQRFSDAPLQVHDGCGGNVSRLLSAPGLQFKGSGWYITDYARNSGGTDKAKDGAAKSETSGESKPGGESKGEPKPSTTSTKTE